MLASGSSDRTARVWDPAVSTHAVPPAGDSGPVQSVALGADRNGRLLLASASRGETVLLWDVATGRPAGVPLTGHKGSVFGLAFGVGPDDGLLLATASGDETVWLWDSVTGRRTGAPLRGPSGSVPGPGPPPSHWEVGRRPRGLVRLWDPVSCAQVAEPLAGHRTTVTSVAFGSRADGRLLLASGSMDCTIRVWDPLAATLAVAPLTGHRATVTSVAFGTGVDGRLLLASGGEDHTVRLWDPVTGNQIGEPLAGHAATVTSVAFGTGVDGRLLLASGGEDHTVRLWDPVPGICTVTLQRRSAVRSIASLGSLAAIGDDEGVCAIELAEPPA